MFLTSARGCARWSINAETSLTNNISTPHSPRVPYALGFWYKRDIAAWTRPGDAIPPPLITIGFRLFSNNDAHLACSLSWYRICYKRVRALEYPWVINRAWVSRPSMKLKEVPRHWRNLERIAPGDEYFVTYPEYIYIYSLKHINLRIFKFSCHIRWL